MRSLIGDHTNESADPIGDKLQMSHLERLHRASASAHMALALGRSWAIMGRHGRQAERATGDQLFVGLPPKSANKWACSSSRAAACSSSSKWWLHMSHSFVSLLCERSKDCNVLDGSEPNLAPFSRLGIAPGPLLTGQGRPPVGLSSRCPIKTFTLAHSCIIIM